MDEKEQKKETMSLHRGLAELKLIDAKIEKKIEEIQPSGHKQKNKKVFGKYDEKEFIEKAQSDFDSIINLIERKNKIKCAIVLKNAETKFKIGDKEMTIAQAITYKSFINTKKLFIDTLNNKHKGITLAGLEKNNTIVTTNCQRMVEASVGKDNVKVSDNDIEALSKPYMAFNEFHLVDPLKIEEKISSLREEVMTFETEIDAVLSEVNATTVIEF